MKRVYFESDWNKLTIQAQISLFDKLSEAGKIQNYNIIQNRWRTLALQGCKNAASEVWWRKSSPDDWIYESFSTVGMCSVCIPIIKFQEYLELTGIRKMTWKMAGNLCHIAHSVRCAAHCCCCMYETVLLFHVMGRPLLVKIYACFRTPDRRTHGSPERTSNRIIVSLCRRFIPSSCHHQTLPILQATPDSITAKQTTRWWLKDGNQMLSDITKENRTRWRYEGARWR